MPDKDLYDWSFFTAADSASDLLGHMIRWGLTMGIQPRTKFAARALTDIQPLNALQASAVDGANSPGTANRRYWFKARIIGHNSPHSFIPDPCDPAHASDLDYVYKLISMHTSFISLGGANDVSPVTRGDVIRVELNLADDKYQLQYGTYLKLLSIEDPPDNKNAECASLVSLFGKIEHTPLPGLRKTKPMGAQARYVGGATYEKSECNQSFKKGKIPKFTLAELEQLRADGIFTDLLYVIHTGESSGMNYSAINKGLAAGGEQASILKGAFGTTDLTTVTIGRLKAAGSKCAVRPYTAGSACFSQYGGDPSVVFAAGRYQIIPGTLLSLLGKNAKAMGIATPVYPDSQLFDEKTQDILAIIGLMARRPAIGRYLTGMMDQPCSAITELAAEWASIPLPIDRGSCKKGQSYYCGGSDKAAPGHTLGEIEAILAAARARLLASGAYASALSAGRVGPTGA